MNEIALSVNPAGLEIAHLEQFFGAWAMHPETFESVARQISTMDLAAHVAAAKPRSAEQESGYRLTDDGVAVIQINGTLTKYGSSFTGRGMVAMRKAVRSAARDESARAIVLQIDSPGGTISGTSDLAQEVAAAAAVKPLIAYIEDMGASAAYWIASQAPVIYINETGMAGSIGVFTVVNDFSGAAERDGVRVHVIKTGQFKGAGAPGARISDAQLEEVQRIVSDLNAQFIGAVAGGRKMDREKVAALADGRVHIGMEAVKLGLADGVRSLDSVIGEAARLTTHAPKVSGGTPPAGNPHKMKGSIMDNDAKNPEGAGPVTQPAALTEQQVQAMINAAVEKATAGAIATERQRASAIMALARQYGLAEVGEKLVASGATEPDATVALKDARIEALTKTGATNPGPNMQEQTAGGNESAAALTASAQKIKDSRK